MFTGRLNELLDKTGATGADVARLVGFDRTNISRIRSGKRTPTPDSVTTARLIEGIYLFSDNKNDLKTLCALVGADPKSPASDIKKQIGLWLYADYTPDLSEMDASRKKHSGISSNVAHTFGERMNAAMNLAELTNVRLGQLLHADASIISRYRNGLRTPMSNPELSLLISEILYDRILKNEKEKELSKLLHMPAREIDDEAFTSWLYGKSDLQDDHVLAAEDFLGFFDTFDVTTKSALLSVDELLTASDGDSAPVYFGNDGFRSAVLRFLTTAITCRAKELLLYSDEDQSWMTGDHLFLAKWATLMFACVKNGTRIRIIHNLDRDMSEMTDAIKSWLPLYMTGMIESYSCKKQKSSRFSHTLFLMPGIACIKAFHAIGSEGENIYHYYSEENILSICEKEYEALLKSSYPLIHPLLSLSYPKECDVVTIQNVLSVGTMSKELAESFNSPALLETWELSRTALLEDLKTNSVYELVPLVKAADLKDGCVPVGQSYPMQHNLFYTKDQYRMHIRDIIKLTNEYDNYRLYPILEPPFKNIDLLISDNITEITPAYRPGLSFALRSSSMCTAFKAYAKTLRDKYKMDRHSLRNMLEEEYL